MPFDFNGDGKDDFIRQEKGAYAADDIDTAQVYLSNGNGTFSSQLLTDYIFQKGDFVNLIVGDYNGDGRDDFIRQEKGEYAVDDIDTAQVYLSNGKFAKKKVHMLLIILEQPKSISRMETAHFPANF
ncbi:VCBS repeat-containing protein [Nostoc sp. LPT]|uniref:FG-GAP repeat domain-containing protein n=1 Tax=Nostoc sp. LPT TaxID=2815387 RepID=UPI001DBB46F3|nr:VCBS repeat-containing protein [Nostoc sp. LPT]MBN4002625.1 VCBS repeat-containing protein [Nostoc sp. LPT]